MESNTDDNKVQYHIVMPSDKDRVKDIVKHYVYEKKKEEWDQKRFEWGILRRMFDPFQRNGTFIAEDKSTNKIIAIIFGELRVDPFGLSECLIKQMFVESSYRGKGIGRKLFETHLNHLRNIKIKRVKVNLHLKSVKTKALIEEFEFKPKYMVWERDL